MRRRVLLLVAVMALLFTMALPAGAITRGGTLDGNDHPYVGLMVAADFDTGSAWRCSGTLISPTVYVTAGHCTFGADIVWLYMQSDLEPDPSVYGYPFGSSITGTAYAHPLYNDAAFYLYDLGVVVLDTPVVLADYADLPSAGHVDDNLGNGRDAAQVTAVGYGLQQVRSNPAGPDFTIDDKTRFQADLFVVNTQGVAGIGNLPVPGDQPPTNSMILSGDSKHGGTCFGDSGGPTLDEDTLLAVTSFGLNGNCGGIGGVFRIDRDYELDWIDTFLP